jgi:TolB-like protein
VAVGELSYADDGALLDAETGLLLRGRDPARVALVIDDANEPRRHSLEHAMARLLRERGGAELLTPAYVRGVLDAAAERSVGAGDVKPLQSLSADHVLLGTVVDEAGQSVLRLRLVFVQTGEVLASTRVPLRGAGVPSTAGALPVSAVCADIADSLAEAVESAGVDVKLHRVAVGSIVAQAGAAKDGRVDRFMQMALAEALRDRGFLVVERAQLGAALDQMALGQALDDDKVPALGKLLSAQSVVLGTVSEAGATFLLNARLVSVESGTVLGAGSGVVPRTDVVTLAAVETRTPGEAAIRSALVPGWGQSENGQAGKALLLGVPTWLGVASTVGLGVGTGLSWDAYVHYAPKAGTSALVAGNEASGLRTQTNALVVATGISAALTATLWAVGVVDAYVSSPHDGT